MPRADGLGVCAWCSKAARVWNFAERIVEAGHGVRLLIGEMICADCIALAVEAGGLDSDDDFWE